MADDEDSAGEPRGDTAIETTQRLLEWWMLHERKLLPDQRHLNKEEERQFWLITIKVLMAFADELDGGHKAAEHVLLRADPVRYVACVIEEQLHGITPLGLRPRKGVRRGRTWAGPQRVGIGYARAYLQAIAEELIVDNAHNKTVRDAYKVGDDTVQNWAKLPLGYQWDVLQMHLLRAGSANARLAAAKKWLRQGAHFYGMAT
jgi:hypothetical protein